MTIPLYHAIGGALKRKGRADVAAPPAATRPTSISLTTSTTLTTKG